jgi:hypothetical protein
MSGIWGKASVAFRSQLLLTLMPTSPGLFVFGEAGSKNFGRL